MHALDFRYGRLCEVTRGGFQEAKFRRPVNGGELCFLAVATRPRLCGNKIVWRWQRELNSRRSAM
jgi:hypothetical protein